MSTFTQRKDPYRIPGRRKFFTSHFPFSRACVPIRRSQVPHPSKQRRGKKEIKKAKGENEGFPATFKPSALGYIVYNKSFDGAGGERGNGDAGGRPTLVVVLSRRARGVSLIALVLAGLFATLFVDGGSLLDAGVVALELNPRILREVEDVLHDLASRKSAQRKPAGNR